MVTFAHFSDVHIGVWRDPKLRDISTRAFAKAVDLCIQRKVDFAIIAGDLFNTAIPSMDLLKQAVTKIKDLKDVGIPVYVVPGSHDYSASGKTMIDVLEEAGLLINVCKGEAIDGALHLRFTIDKKTGIKLTGMLGRKGQLEHAYYESLHRDNLEQESGEKIFVFHSAIQELKPAELAEMDAAPLSLLPKGFKYYAAGHVHAPSQHALPGYAQICYPGPLFPCNFKELEQLGKGGFFLVQDWKPEWVSIQLYSTFTLRVDADGKNPQQTQEDILQQLQGKEFINTIVLMRVEGTLASGKPSDIDFVMLFKHCYDHGAHYVMRNTTKLSAVGFAEIKVEQRSVEELEQQLIQEHLQQIKIGLSAEQESQLMRDLLTTLDLEKAEGERAIEFEERVRKAAEKVLRISESN